MKVGRGENALRIETAENHLGETCEQVRRFRYNQMRGLAMCCMVLSCFV